VIFQFLLTLTIDIMPRESTIEDKVPKSVRQQYTDILAHEYEPNGGHHMVVGTNFGELSIVLVDPKPEPIVKRNRPGHVRIREPSARDQDQDESEHVESGGNSKNEPEHLLILSTIKIPKKEAIVGLHWGEEGIFVGSRSAFYLYKWNGQTQEIDPVPAVTINCPFDVLDICGVMKSPEKLILACDDSKARVYDMNTEKLILELPHHTGIVEVCVSSEEHMATAAQDGFVHMYDAEFRSNAPVQTFDHSPAIVNNIALNKSSTWLAVVGRGFSAPSIHNVRSGNLLKPFEMDNPTKIYSVTFDRRGHLYWGGEEGIVYKSEGLSEITGKFDATFGGARIPFIYSISTALTSYGGIRLSACGTGNGILISENAKYWNTFFRV